jgi:hypothetical protein
MPPVLTSPSISRLYCSAKSRRSFASFNRAMPQPFESAFAGQRIEHKLD